MSERIDLLFNGLKESVLTLQKNYLSLESKAEEQSKKHQSQIESLMEQLIGVLDLIGLAENNLAENNVENGENTLVFFKKIKKRLIKILASQNVVGYSYQENQKIGDNVKVVGTRYVPELEDGVVLECFREGYLLNDQVLRYCEVITNKIPSDC